DNVSELGLRFLPLGLRRARIVLRTQGVDADARHIGSGNIAGLETTFDRLYGLAEKSGGFGSNAQLLLRGDEILIRGVECNFLLALNIGVVTAACPDVVIGGLDAQFALAAALEQLLKTDCS